MTNLTKLLPMSPIHIVGNNWNAKQSYWLSAVYADEMVQQPVVCIMCLWESVCVYI